MADNHLDSGGWEWHFDDTNNATKAILTRVVRVGTASTEVNIPAQLFSGINLLTIGAGCFNDTEGRKITKVLSMPSTVTSIGDYAFYGLTLMTDVVIGSGVITIGNQSFDSCYKLTTFTLPDSVVSMGSWPFQNCIILTTVNIGVGFTTLTISPDNRPFANCPKLSDINVAAGNITFASIDGVMYNKLFTTLIKCPVDNVRTTYTIPNSVTAIGAISFYKCIKLTEIIMGTGVVTVDWWAFANCEAITSLSYPNSVTTIGTSANCAKLASIHLGNSVSTIAADWVLNCPLLASITVDAGNTTFRDISGVLYNKAVTMIVSVPCAKTGTYVIANTVTRIYNSAFLTTKLSSIVVPAVTTIDDWAFNTSYLLTSIVWLGHDVPTSIGTGIFQGVPLTCRGHAYSDSHFPAPGNVFPVGQSQGSNGILMGVVITLNSKTILSDSRFSPPPIAKTIQSDSRFFKLNNTLTTLSDSKFKSIFTKTILSDTKFKIQTSHATLNAEITDIGGDLCDERGFDWGYASGIYTYTWTETGSYDVGTFSHVTTELTQGATIYFRGKAHNKAGWEYFDEESFYLPLAKRKTILSDTIFINNCSKTILSDSIFKLTITDTILSDSRYFKIGNVKTILSASRFFKPDNIETVLSTSRFKQSFSETKTSDAQLKLNKNINKLSDAHFDPNPYSKQKTSDGHFIYYPTVTTQPATNIGEDI